MQRTYTVTVDYVVENGDDQSLDQCVSAAVYPFAQEIERYSIVNYGADITVKVGLARVESRII
jgi:hypothetical protein